MECLPGELLTGELTGNIAWNMLDRRLAIAFQTSMLTNC